MKKIFPLFADSKLVDNKSVDNKSVASKPAGAKSPERLLETAKSDIRKYLKRERAKPLPKGIHFWDFEDRKSTRLNSSHVD